jgi:hypothetical protein
MMNESNSKDVYELKHCVREEILERINDECFKRSPYISFYHAIGLLNRPDDAQLGREGYIDLLDAALSGKRVVNPKTDRERLEEIRDKYPFDFDPALATTSIDVRDLKFLFRLAHEHVTGGDHE